MYQESVFVLKLDEQWDIGSQETYFEEWECVHALFGGVGTQFSSVQCTIKQAIIKARCLAVLSFETSSGGGHWGRGADSGWGRSLLVRLPLKPWLIVPYHSGLVVEWFCWPVLMVCSQWHGDDSGWQWYCQRVWMVRRRWLRSGETCSILVATWYCAEFTGVMLMLVLVYCVKIVVVRWYWPGQVWMLWHYNGHLVLAVQWWTDWCGTVVILRWL